MKAMLFGMAALGIGGAFMTGSMGGHDAERTVAQPIEVVYGAVSDMAPEGVQAGNGGDPDAYSVKVEKDPGNSITYRILDDEKMVAEVKFGFESAGEGSTRITADLEIDKPAFAQIDDDSAPRIAAMPDGLLNMGLRRAVREMGEMIENGMPLPTLMEREASLRNEAEMSVGARSYRARAQQRAAAAPMSSAKPMVDPNDSARDYMNN